MKEKKTKIEKFYEKIFEESEHEKDDPNLSDKITPENDYNNSIIKCPECGAPMREQPYPDISGEGVGPTQSISTKIYPRDTELVCLNCGYVLNNKSNMPHGD